MSPSSPNCAVGAEMLSPPTQSLTAESSQAKVAFMGAVGLWRVPEEEKQGKELGNFGNRDDNSLKMQVAQRNFASEI